MEEDEGEEVDPGIGIEKSPLLADGAEMNSKSLV